MRYLDATQSRIERSERLFQLFGPDQEKHRVHGYSRRLLIAIVEHRHPMNAFVGRQQNSESVRKVHLGCESIGVDALQLLVLLLRDSLIAEKCVAQVVFARRPTLRVEDLRPVANDPDGLGEAEIPNRLWKMMRQDAGFKLDQ